MLALFVIGLGQGKSTADHNGLLWLSSISESEKSDLDNLIKTGPDSVLKRAWLGLYDPSKHPRYWMNYQDAQVLIGPHLSFDL